MLSASRINEFFENQIYIVKRNELIREIKLSKDKTDTLLFFILLRGTPAPVLLLTRCPW